MVIQPKIRGFICTTSHPVGCKEHVEQQIQYVQRQPSVEGPRRVLVIGASTGYGLASRIVAAFGSNADTVGVFLEKPGTDARSGTAGWYNTVAFTEAARSAGRVAENINGDAFSDEVKKEAIDVIREKLGQVDLVVYSLASPRRTHPKTQEVFSSVLKPIGAPFSDKTVDPNTGVVSTVTVNPASEEEVRQTVAVMGGEDWEMWMKALMEAGVLAPGFNTVAYSYLGPQLTRAIYRDGAIGRAKDDLEATAKRMNQQYSAEGAHAFVSINKAVVTQASSAIPVVPLYISLLFKTMKERNTHEDCIEQMYRVVAQRLYSGEAVPLDEEGRIRLDELEMDPETQRIVHETWKRVNTDNVYELSDLAGYKSDFLKLFGFALDGVDYDADVNPNLSWE